MTRPDLGRLRWRLLAANLAVATAGVVAVAVGVWLAAPLAFDDAMGMNGSGGMMGGSGAGMMDPLLRAAFGDAVGLRPGPWPRCRGCRGRGGVDPARDAAVPAARRAGRREPAGGRRRLRAARVRGRWRARGSCLVVQRDGRCPRGERAAPPRPHRRCRPRAANADRLRPRVRGRSPGRRVHARTRGLARARRADGPPGAPRRRPRGAVARGVERPPAGDRDARRPERARGCRGAARSRSRGEDP